MTDFLAFVVRLVVGAASLVVAFLVLDAIHDRNTEIVVACIGLGYCFTFVISRRWQYYGLNAVSLFGMTVSWLNAAPYDQGVRHQLNMPIKRSFTAVSIFFAAVVELLCAYRLLTSLLGHGWERLAEPLRPLLDIPQARAWLDLL
jgi:NhaP-type Na+/H+ or K+/H+ antiporter